MQHKIIFIILVFTLVAHASNVFALQSLFKFTLLKFISFLVITHTPTSENLST